MKRIASKMKLRPGFETEYKKRHDELWPELEALLLSRGIAEYSIFLDEETQILFAFLEVNDDAELSSLAGEEIMRRWWLFMKDIMDTNADNSPVNIPLKEMFHLSGS